MSIAAHPGTGRRGDGVHAVTVALGRARCLACALALALSTAIAAIGVFGPPALLAKEAPEVGADPAAERHMMLLASELRCLQCQNQTLADSSAPLAVDLRQQIRELIAKGQTDEQIKAYLGARYGDFVFYRPPLQSNTLLLWFGPALVLVGGLIALFITLRRRQAMAEAGAANGDLSEAEALHVRRLLEDDSEQGSLS
jgi:cytochrome c-type biogenesis protein CcmH